MIQIQNNNLVHNHKKLGIYDEMRDDEMWDDETGMMTCIV